MRLTDILSPKRLLLVPPGDRALSRDEALHVLAEALASEADTPEEELWDLLVRRERLQSTGIGEGVAIPHSVAPRAKRQVAAALLAPGGIDFESVDAKPVTIILAVVGPRHATGEHLQVLARISRLLRVSDFRADLLRAQSAAEAWERLVHQEAIVG